MNMGTEKQFCTFYLQGLFFGIEVEKVQEVIRYQGMTEVPLAANVIAGLINLRGQIVTAIDLRKRLGLPSREAGEVPVNVVVRADGGAVSLLVDEIGDVVEVDEKMFEAAPSTLKGQSRELLTGVFKLKDKLLLALDTEKALDVSQLAEQSN
jgi:purine-binding chemotaxis protein CheW